MFFLDILTGYVLPIIYDSFVVLVLVLLFLFIFRIKDSNMRILFFFLPLIKPFIMILERVDVERLYSISGGKASGIRFPDPTSIIRISNSPIEGLTDLNLRILIVIFTMVMAFLIVRWVIIALFYRRLAFEDKVGRREIPKVFDTIDDFSKNANIKTPEVSLTHRNYVSPFVVGLKRVIEFIDNLLKKGKDNENINAWSSRFYRFSSDGKIIERRVYLGGGGRQR